MEILSFCVSLVLVTLLVTDLVKVSQVSLHLYLEEELTKTGVTLKFLVVKNYMCITSLATVLCERNSCW